MRIVLKLATTWLCFCPIGMAEIIAPQWSVADVGFGVKPTFDFSLDGRLQVTGMTEQFSGGILWHATAESFGSDWETSVVARSFFYGPGDMVVADDGTAHIAVHDHNARDAMHVEVSPQGDTNVRHLVTPNERDGWENSLAFDSIGRLHQVTVNPAGPGVVNSLSLSSFDGDEWKSQVIVNSSDFTHSLGTSLAFDVHDEPHILFTPAKSQTEPTDLMHAFREGANWTFKTVAADGIRGRYSSLAFDSMNRGHAAWLDIDQNDSSAGIVMYGQFVDGRWVNSEIDRLENVKLGPSGGLNMVSLVIGPDDSPHVAYGDSQTVNYATMNDGRWQKTPVLYSDTERYNGLSVLRLHPKSGQPHIAFWEPHEIEAGVIRLLSQDILGDFDRDGRLSALDIDLLADQFGKMEPSALFDLTADGVVDELDHQHWVTTVVRTSAGDANLDGQFDSSDLVQVFKAAKYERPELGDVSWSDGDWNGDQRFTSSDIVHAFVAGGYQRAAVAVPEPTSKFLLVLPFVTILRSVICSSLRRRQKM